MKKTILPTLLTIFMLLSMLAPVAYATETTAPETTAATEAPTETTAATEAVEETEASSEATEETTEATEETKAPVSTATSGDCGPGLTWSFSGGKLTVSGSGDMAEGCPWEHLKEDITSVSLTGGVTSIAAEAFADCDSLTSIDFGGSLREVGARAFQDCDAIKTITLPESFRKFGEEAFQSTDSLTTVYCNGPMPSFKGNCLWNGNFVTVHYPINNPWPESEVLRLVSNFNGRLSIIVGDTTITYEDTTQPTTAPTTAPTTEPTTVPTTAPTVPETTEAPATLPTFAPETTPSAPTAPATDPTFAPTDPAPEMTEPVEEEKGLTLDGTIIGTILVAGCLTFFLIGALIFRIVSRKGGRYSK